MTKNGNAVTAEVARRAGVEPLREAVDDRRELVLQLSCAVEGVDEPLARRPSGRDRSEGGGYANAVAERFAAALSRAVRCGVVAPTRSPERRTQSPGRPATQRRLEGHRHRRCRALKASE